MSKPSAVEQTLYPWLGRLICAPCCDTIHKHCEGGGCTCACHDSCPPRKQKVKRDRDGLSEEERKNQIGFPFDDYSSLKI